ncbi:MAG: protein translocase subunit SecF [Pseudomonadota bacterium]|nr:protein translocase subunit SecF [Pseudomonadota bacterium]
MKPILHQTHIDFMKWRKVAMTVSLTVLVLAIASIAIRGLNFGIDFTGGTLIELGYGQPVKLGGIRETLSDSGFERTTVQHFGTSHDVLVRLAPEAGRNNAELSDSVVEVLRVNSPEVEVRRIEFVGPQVGEELREDGGLAMVYALIGILVYVTMRFEYRFSFGSVIALVHDVIITVGFFALTGIEFDLPVLAAVLAVIGYSLNDTIVVYDRIRENFRKMRKADTVGIVNTSINQTLSRTVVTSLTTLLVLLALFFLGGSVIHSFALALIVGVVVGTYSSIYVASSSILTLGVSKKDLLPIQRESPEAEDRP